MRLEKESKIKIEDAGLFRDLYFTSLLESDSKDERIAALLHEEIGSELMALRMMVDQSKLDTEEKSSITDGLNAVMTKIKMLSSQLASPQLNEIGLSTAIENKCKTLSNASGVTVRFTADGDKSYALEKRLQKSAYLAITELMVCLIHHSKPTKIFVNALSKQNKFSVRIADDGEGLDFDEIIDSGKGCSHLMAVYGRLNQIKAQLEFEKTDKGSTITINIGK